MNKPYTICHILSSLDGKINGPFMETESTAELAGKYAALRSELAAGAWMYGTTTTKELLYDLFHIKKLLICGGGLVNWSFLQAGMIDELSLVLAPVSDGGSGSASLFAQKPAFSEEAPVEFSLKRVEKIGENGLYLNYLVRHERSSL